MAWAEEQDWFGTEDMIEQFPDPEEEIKNGYWIMNDWEPIALRSMTDTHLANSVRIIEEGRLNRPWALPYLKAEIERRKK